jgi:hypothetical protein
MFYAAHRSQSGTGAIAFCGLLAVYASAPLSGANKVQRAQVSDGQHEAIECRTFKR